VGNELPKDFIYFNFVTTWLTSLGSLLVARGSWLVARYQITNIVFLYKSRFTAIATNSRKIPFKKNMIAEN
ncbi:MAG TPA: hypothetical protein PLY70_10250, partial [Saprospiraceae bacterium]|nr:hypothetical protein [Saprospiraceae bacterium]